MQAGLKTSGLNLSLGEGLTLAHLLHFKRLN